MFRLKISGWRLRSRLEDFARMEIGLYIGQAQIARRVGQGWGGVGGGCVQLGAAVLPVKVIRTECCQLIQSFWSFNRSVISYVPCLAWRKNQWQQSCWQHIWSTVFLNPENMIVDLWQHQLLYIIWCRCLWQLFLDKKNCWAQGQPPFSSNPSQRCQEEAIARAISHLWPSLKCTLKWP